MGDKMRELLTAKRRRGWYLALMLVLAVLVTAGVGGLFHQPAVAKTYQVTALTCSAEAPVRPGYAGYFVHTHNEEDCFDENGNLVCPLPEIKAHVHDETCYTTTSVQTCGLAESDGHQHSEACYTRVRGDLICGKSTEPVLDEAGNVLEEGHVHTDECFAWTEELTCGMVEGEGAHHHNDSCFEYVTSLSCGMPEVILHTHTDDCYQKNEDGSIYVDEDGNTWLICGLPEVTEHVHGPECFTVYELDDEEAVNTENTEGEESGLIFLFPEEEEEEEQPAESANPEAETDATDASDAGNTDPADGNTPDTDNAAADAEEAKNAEPTDETDPNAEGEDQDAASGEEAPIAEEPHEVVYTGTRGAEKGGVTVLAEIPEGALDESAQLVLGDADESAARNLILQVVNANAAEGEEREIFSMLLMDIGFVSGGEPAVLNGLDPVRVTLRAAAIRTMSAPKLFHLSGETAQEVKDVLFDAKAGTAVFTAAAFSPFAIVDLTGEDPAAETAEETVSVPMPAQSFTGETESVIVSVEAPEGAFPAGTTMVVRPVEMDDETLSNVTGAVESSGEQKLVTAQAVDISFFDAEGTLIEPKLPIKVSMKSALVSESENVALVHLTETATAEPAENAEAETTEAPAAPTAEVVTDVQVVENPDEHNEIQFESDAFSVYVLVGTETITTYYITADGETYTITVTYGPEAGIPAGAALAVAEIPQDSEEYAAYLAQAQTAVKAGSTAGSAAASAEPAEATEEAAEAVEVAPASAVDAENAESAIGTTDRVTVTTARFFDITILDAEGNPVEPAAPVDVKIEYMEPAETAENYQVVHFGEGTEVLNPAVSGADGAASTFDFQTNSFSIFGVVGTKIIKADVLLSDGNLYTVSVTYEEDAHIPSGSSLMVVTFEEGTTEYEYARNSVLADKKARGEWVDLSNFGLAALDISIIDPEGNEIEPAAPVQVEIRIKELPGVENLNEVAGTLAIQHHVETEDGIVVETVYDGGTEASFRMDTNEAVAAEGKAVDPDAADLSAFEFSSFDLYSDGSIVTNALETEDDEIEVSFPTPVFSTFTVTWNNNSTTSNQLRVSQLSNGKYILYARDAANNNYYALVPGTALNSAQVTVNGDLVQYSGSENLYWDVETSGSGDNQRIYFSFTQNGTKYYLAAGTTGNKVTTNRNRNGYGNANTTEWRQWDNCIHSAGDTFLQSYNGTFRTWNVAGIYPFQDRSAVYFEKQGAGASNSSATIHYVDENGNELTVSNGQPVNDTNGNLNYLIYDVNGYEYAYTYRNDNTSSNRITPILRYRNNRWQYTTGTDRDGNNSWTNLSQDDDIYVVYKPKASVPEGGTPVPKITGERPDTPTITKDSMVNGDGTNTLSLSVTGHTSIMEAEKLADVIVVYDVSGSMRFRMDSETDASVGQRRMDYAQAATKALAKSLLGKNTAEHPDLIRMALISFSNTAQKVQDFTADKTTFTDAVDDLPAPDGGTNWEYALQIANEMAVESDRATFVIFVTDGNPTFRQTRGTLNNSSTNNGLGVTQYNASLGYTVGDVGSYFYQYRVYGGGDNDDWGRNYAAALVQAKSIVSHSKNFYTIGISNDVTNLTKLTTEAGAGADHSKTATSNEELVAAFDEIAASIIAHLGHSDVKITDGITDLTQTVQKSSLVNFAEDDFTYYKKHDYDIATQKDVDEHRASAVGEKIQVNGAWEPWAPVSEGCNEAVYNKTTGAVEWNMGEGFMLEDGYSYQVRFKVWPSQEAYDLLADLNNGVKSYASLTDAEKAQIKEPTSESGGMYTLKTNSETSYTYREATKSGDTVTPTGEPSEPGSFPDVDPLKLTTEPLKVKKQWHYNYTASRTPVKSITMELYGVSPDGTWSHDFKTIELNESGNWQANNNYISYGLVTYNANTDRGEKIYETGHDFTLRETDDEAHYYELTAGVYRPMFINGTPTILEKVDAAPTGMEDSVFHYSDGSHHYYRLDGKIYRDTLSDILVIATNSRRSVLDLNKVVVDESNAVVVDDTEFEYQITFTVPSGTANYENVEKYIWFSVNDAQGQRLNPSNYIHDDNLIVRDSYLVATSGTPFMLKIKQGWNVRFLNLPIGTTYSFTETNIRDGYSFVEAEVSGTRWIANMVDGNDNGQAETMTGLPSNNGDTESTGISGRIDYANACYNTTYTNRAKSQKVNILKTSQDGTTELPGAVFSLYTESGYTAEPKSPSATELTSDSSEIVELGKLSVGTYYLVETKAPNGYNLKSQPIVITVTASGVTYDDGTVLSQSKAGISQTEGDVYQLKVTNDSGVELPATGGEGTLIFSVLGTILILSSTLLILAKRKQEAYTPRH